LLRVLRVTFATGAKAFITSYRTTRCTIHYAYTHFPYALYSLRCTYPQHFTPVACTGTVDKWARGARGGRSSMAWAGTIHPHPRGLVTRYRYALCSGVNVAPTPVPTHTFSVYTTHVVSVP